MESIQRAITRAVAENRMRAQLPTDADAAEHIWVAVQEAMKAEGMILFGRPITMTMLERQISETGKFELALAEVAQELNDALSSFDYAPSRGEAGQALKALVDAARLSITMIEQTNPNWPLHKPPPSSIEDRQFEYHFLRGTVPHHETPL